MARAGGVVSRSRAALTDDDLLTANGGSGSLGDGMADGGEVGVSNLGDLDGDGCPGDDLPGVYGATALIERAAGDTVLLAYGLQDVGAIAEDRMAVGDRLAVGDGAGAAAGAATGEPTAVAASASAAASGAPAASATRSTTSARVRVGP